MLVRMSGSEKMAVRQGYLSREYAQSFQEFGTPVALPSCGGWLIERPVGQGMSDAMGCYPLFCCEAWSRLGGDLAALDRNIVSLVLVSDPFADAEEPLLRRCFERVRPYKEHFVIDTREPMSRFTGSSSRHQALRSLRTVEVDVCANPLDHLDEWERLFAVLAARHGISGLRRFSREAFRRQLSVPGLVMFRAVAERTTVGLDLWYVQDDVAQGHLAAFDALGYRLHASYATKWRMIEYFMDKVRWINLGAGTNPDGSDGLSLFKKGFATGTKPSFLCGSILRPGEYEALVQERDFRAPTDYFPAYRAGELA